MKKIILFSLSVLCVMLCLAGCGSTNKLVGVWTEINGEGILYFAEDNTGMSANVRYATESFDYEENGDKLTFFVEKTLETNFVISEDILTITVDGTDYKYERVKIAEDEIDGYLADNGIDISVNSDDTTIVISLSEDPSSDDPSEDDSSNGDSSADDTSVDNPSNEDSSDDNSSNDDSSADEPSAEDSSDGDITDEAPENSDDPDSSDTLNGSDTPNSSDAPVNNLTDEEIAESIVGAWYGGDNNAKLTYIFLEDGTGTAAIFPFTYSVKNGVITITIEGFNGEVETGSAKYEISGDLMYVETKNGLVVLKRTEVPDDLFGLLQ